MDSLDTSRQLLETLRSGAVLIEAGAMWMNSAAERITGYRSVDFTSVDDYIEKLLMTVAASKAHEVRAAFAARGNSADAKIEALQIARGNGAKCWIEHEFGCLAGAEIWLLRDVTDRILAQENAAKQTRLLRRVCRLAEIGGWEVDVETRRIFWSEEVYRLYELDPQTVITSEDSKAPYSPEIRAQFDAAFRDLAVDGKSWEIEVPFVGAKGTHRQVRLIVGVESEVGRPARMVGTLQDVSERYRINEALKEARLRAEAASRAKSEFLANMSHEIRTPMNGVIGMTELLLETPLDDTQRDYARTVSHSANALLTVINDILDFSKVEAGKLELECIDMNPRDAVQEVARLLAIQAHAKDLELTIQVDPTIPDLVRGDSGRLRQVLLNLGGNAVKFTKQGEISVEVKYVSGDESGTLLRFDIRDTGIGIPAPRLSALFQPFSQVDSSTTRQFGGTGLGLSIVRCLVELMGGESGVQSQEGQGSCFWFTARFAAASKLSLPPRLTPLALRDLRVLVVDDNATNRRVLATQLEQSGCAVACATSANEAIVLMQEAVRTRRPFEVALLDHQMPGRDGADLGRQIVADEALKSTRLILLTSSGRGSDGKMFAEIGFSAYLLKPVAQRDLIDCLLVTTTAEAEAWHTQTQPIVTSQELSQLRARTQRRILVAEDNAVNQKVARRLLETLGYEVVIAINGKAAVEAWEAQAFDLILMDCQMPELDGYQATAQIRQRENGQRRIPIIALTADAMKGADVACREAGMDEHLTKPIDRKRLEACLEHFLSQDTLSRRRPRLSEAAIDEPVSLRVKLVERS